MDQTCFGSRCFFWPMSNPLFPGSWTSVDRAYRHRGCSATPPSASLYRERIILYRLSSPAPQRSYSRPTTSGARRPFVTDFGSELAKELHEWSQCAH
jgi:hypothetical protein